MNIPVSRGTLFGALDLANNRIVDLAPLILNQSLPRGYAIDLRDNPIDCGAEAGNVQSLRARGVSVTLDCP